MQYILVNLPLPEYIRILLAIYKIFKKKSMCVVIWNEICSLQYCSECWSENHDSNGVLSTTNCQRKYQSKSRDEIQISCHLLRATKYCMKLLYQHDMKTIYV